MKQEKNVLKGQQTLAQGFDVSAQSNGNALGWRMGIKIVRPARQGLSGGAITIINERLMWRTNMYDRSIHPNNDLQFPACGRQAANVNFRIVNRLCAADFRDIPFTQGVALG